MLYTSPPRSPGAHGFLECCSDGRREHCTLTPPPGSDIFQGGGIPFLSYCWGFGFLGRVASSFYFASTSLGNESMGGGPVGILYGRFKKTVQFGFVR